MGVEGQLDYKALLETKLDAKKSEPAKQAIQQRTLLLKLRQATHELMQKRDSLVLRACQMDDAFADREKAYKAQARADCILIFFFLDDNGAARLEKNGAGSNEC